MCPLSGGQAPLQFIASTCFATFHAAKVSVGRMWQLAALRGQTTSQPQQDEIPRFRAESSFGRVHLFNVEE